MTSFRVAEAARLLGVSDDTVRRWADAGKLHVVAGEGGRRVVEGAELARFATEQAGSLPVVSTGPVVAESARNHLTGLVTRVVKDGVMAQVDLQAGPFRLVSLMSAEAATELGLEPGTLAVASVKATNVVVAVPAQPA